MKQHILLINDLPGYGKVALSAMIPILSQMGHHLYNLPTALVSNTLDYGKFDILETTDYMQNTIAIWDELGFEFDAIATGFIVSERQARLVADYCRHQSEKGKQIFVDPIMGDAGRLYNGISKNTVSLMCDLASNADYLLPNYTEAAFLAEVPYQEEGMTLEEADFLVDKLRGLGAKSIVITSANVNATPCVIGYDAATSRRFRLPFSLIPARFAGTGDLFSAVFMGKVLMGEPLEAATQKAMDTVYEMLLKNQTNTDPSKGLPIESFAEVIDR